MDFYTLHIVFYRKSARCHSRESWKVILLLAEHDFAQNLTLDGGTIKTKVRPR